MSQKQRIFFWSITAALGGFLFGFDTAVISGVEQSLQTLWHLNVWEHGLTVSIALIGTVLGSMLGGIPAQQLGRKKTLFWIAILYLAGFHRYGTGAQLGYFSGLPVSGWSGRRRFVGGGTHVHHRNFAR